MNRHSRQASVALGIADPRSGALRRNQQAERSLEGWGSGSFSAACRGMSIASGSSLMAGAARET
jgi:hypothetical protein